MSSDQAPLPSTSTPAPDPLPQSLTRAEYPPLDLDAIESEVSELRRCGSCNLEFPLSPAYFHRDATDDQGFQRSCRKCRSELRKRERNARISEVAESLQDKAVKLLEQAVSGNGIVEQVPHTMTVLEDIISCFGGSQGFAQMLFADYLAAAPGGQTRLRFAQLMLKMIDQVSTAGLAKTRHDAKTTDELEGELKQLLSKIMKQQGTHDPQS